MIFRFVTIHRSIASLLSFLRRIENVSPFLIMVEPFPFASFWGKSCRVSKFTRKVYIGPPNDFNNRVGPMHGLFLLPVYKEALHATQLCLRQILLSLSVCARTRGYACTPKRNVKGLQGSSFHRGLESLRVRDNRIVAE